MRVVRDDNRDKLAAEERRRFATNLYNSEIYVQRDFGVIMGDGYYYQFVGDNSRLPFTDLIEPEDAEIFEAAIGDMDEPVEVYTRIRNLIDDGYRNVHIRLENSDKTREGERLWKITITDLFDCKRRVKQLETNVHKYRYFLSLKDEHFFEYNIETNNFHIYKYINEKAISLVQEDFDEYYDYYLENYVTDEVKRQQAETLYRNLKEKSKSFEMEIQFPVDEGEVKYSIKGGISKRVPNLVEGVMTPDGTTSNMAYYLLPEGRDAFTGLFNKKAATEYAMEKLSHDDGKSKWLLIMDIDDFKNVNDNFGHAFGDEVIKKVADTLHSNLASKGIVGRFGGDEFFALLMGDGIESREDLKLNLKVIVKELAYAFDGKFKLTTSIGISKYPKDGKNFDELFGKADKALYIAKEKGKDRHIIYEEEKHGAYTEDSIKTQAVSYLVSRSKRRESLANTVVGVNREGVSYFLNNENVQQDTMDVFDLDGITIYGDYGRRVIFRKGAYADEPDDRARLMEDKKYAAHYEKDEVYAIGAVSKIKAESQYAYDTAVKQEIGASVRVVTKKDGVPYIFMDFDVMNANRKWSDADVDMISIFGASIGNLILSEESR
ncbi:MAG: GGDEF domain-containing protein [Lachnospiraceae bacterium]|nr:GGDEF domain-containing protein [Lachnospiraceae bacterium]